MTGNGAEIGGDIFGVCDDCKILQLSSSTTKQKKINHDITLH